jgi:hypothetical protein
MKKIAFTVVAKNYIGLASILERSIHEYDPDVIFYTFVVDSFGKDAMHLPKNTQLCKDIVSIEPQKWQELTFKYTITELCTAVKPFCFRYLFAKYRESKVLFFDPDVFVFGTLDKLYKSLEKNFVVLTPHIVTMQKIFTGDMEERWMLATGVFNLGFIGLKSCKQTNSVVEWWMQRLLDHCYSDRFEGLFTDQKWIPFLHSFFDSGICVSRNLGFNVAPWNYYEREIISEGKTLSVINRITKRDKVPLVFVHYSGFNYAQLEGDKQSTKYIPHLKFHKDIEQIYPPYYEALKKSDVQKYFNLSYSYGSFSNGWPVMDFHRRLYRRLLQEGFTGDPFDAEKDGSLFSILKNNKLIYEGGIDSLGISSYASFSKKHRLLNRTMIMLKNIIGGKNYMIMAKFFIRYFRPENQIFLLKKKYSMDVFK